MLDPNITFLNHGSFGATPIPVFEEYQRFQRQLELEPVEFLGRQAALLLQRAREVLANYLSVQRDDLVFVPNATHGINIVAHSLDLHPGDEILATDHEYGAMDRTWQFLSQQKGFVYHPVHLSLPLTTKEKFVEEFFSHVSHQTKVIYLSHITSPTALIFPIAEICRKAREMNILTIVDGAHVPGQIDLDLDSLGVDFYTGNCHKWLCAAKGSAFLYARKEVQHLIQPLIVSWGWQAEVPGPSQFIDYLEWTGTRDISPYLTVPAAIEFQNIHDWNKVHLECHHMADQIQQQIHDSFGTTPLFAISDWFAQMVSVVLPASIAVTELQQKLLTDFRIEIPIIPWQGKTLARISVQGYNTSEDLAKLFEALKIIFKH
jgi:isopenicillin-N epimerase